MGPRSWGSARRVNGPPSRTKREKGGATASVFHFFVPLYLLFLSSFSRSFLFRLFSRFLLSSPFHFTFSYIFRLFWLGGGFGQERDDGGVVEVFLPWVAELWAWPRGLRSERGIPRRGAVRWRGRRRSDFQRVRI